MTSFFFLPSLSREYSLKHTYFNSQHAAGFALGCSIDHHNSPHNANSYHWFQTWSWGHTRGLIYSRVSSKLLFAFFWDLCTKTAWWKPRNSVASLSAWERRRKVSVLTEGKWGWKGNTIHYDLRKRHNFRLPHHWRQTKNMAAAADEETLRFLELIHKRNINAILETATKHRHVTASPALFFCSDICHLT